MNTNAVVTATVVGALAAGLAGGVLGALVTLLSYPARPADSGAVGGAEAGGALDLTTAGFGKTTPTSRRRMNWPRAFVECRPVQPELAAERLSIGRTTMYHLVRECQIKTVRIDRLHRVRVTELDRYLDRLHEGQ
jgi:excisionase family DNA binding protein